MLFAGNKKIIKFFCVCALIFTAMPVFLPSQESLALTSAKDTLGLSWPGTGSDHTLQFRLTKDLPASGRIRIVPQAAAFFIPGDFDVDAVDFSVSDASNGIFIDRDLSTTSSATEDMVSVSASTTSGFIDIRLNSSSMIEAGKYLKIELGANADYQASSSSQIVNPMVPGAYAIEVLTYDGDDSYLEKGNILVFIIEPVRMGTFIDKMRSNGNPAGILGFGTTQIILSLNTNYRANCRYSTTASTTYMAMTDSFSFTGAFYHSRILPVSGAGEYNYYVRCRDELDVDDETDFVINFTISGYDGEDGDEDVSGSPGSGGSSGPGSGGGGGGGSGPLQGPGTAEFLPFPELPGSPVVVFRGWSYPNSKINLLKDGTSEAVETAGADGAFQIEIYELPQGVYTFSLWSEDPNSKKSKTQSFTFFIESGTKTEIQNVYISPTVNISDNSIDLGDVLTVNGYASQKSLMDLWVYPKVVGGVTEDKAFRYEGTSLENGSWTINVLSDDFENGIYQVKARSSINSVNFSDFSLIEEFAVGGELPVATCGGADLNADGKVNITDFSILLYWWNSDNACADQNADGNVDLIDFSIMMYYWTG